MYHRVTVQLVLDPGSDATVTEFSRAVPMGDDNQAVFEFWTVSASGDIDRLTAVLQGSNDASKWSDIGSAVLGTGSTGSVPVPGYKKMIISGFIPWLLVRLKYTSETASTDTLMVRGAIETLKG